MLKRTIFVVSNFLLAALCIAAATFLLSSTSREQSCQAPVVAYNVPSVMEAWSSVQAEIPANAKAGSVEDFLELTPRKVKAITGKKMSVKEVVALKIAQKKIKKALAPNAIPPAGNDWAGIVALATGATGCISVIIGLFLCWPLLFLGALLGIAGVVFGIIGLKSSKRGLALAGLITGGLTLLGMVGGLLFLAVG